MGITPSTLTSPMSSSAYRAELTRVRDWLNGGIVIGDLVAEGVNRRHIYRPDVYGFPIGGCMGQTQDAYIRERARTSPPTRPAGYGSVGRLWVARLRERVSIFPQQVPVSGFKIAALAARIHVPASSWVEVGATWEAQAQIRYDGGAGAAYAAGYPSSGGMFELLYREVSASNDSLIVGTQRNLNEGYFQSPMAAPAALRTRFNLFNTGSGVTLSAGTYDVWLHYVRNGTQVDQVIVASGFLKVEVHHA